MRERGHSRAGTGGTETSRIPTEGVLDVSVFACTSQGKLFSRKRSGNCAAFQRAVKDAVKRARFMALLPYVGE